MVLAPNEHKAPGFSEQIPKQITFKFLKVYKPRQEIIKFPNYSFEISVSPDLAIIFWPGFRPHSDAFSDVFSVFGERLLTLTTHTLKSSDREYVRNSMLISLFNQSICAYPFLIMKGCKNLHSKMFDHITCDSYNLKRSRVWNFLRKLYEYKKLLFKQRNARLKEF